MFQRVSTEAQGWADLARSPYVWLTLLDRLIQGAVVAGVALRWGILAALGAALVVALVALRASGGDSTSLTESRRT